MGELDANRTRRSRSLVGSDGQRAASTVHSLEHRRNARLRVVDVGVVLEGVLPEDPHEPVLGLLPLYDTRGREIVGERNRVNGREPLDGRVEKHARRLRPV